MNSADLVAQLRKAADEMRAEDQNGWPVTCDEAADRIEALEAWKAEAMEALREIAGDVPGNWEEKFIAVQAAARRLLEKEDGRDATA